MSAGVAEREAIAGWSAALHPLSTSPGCALWRGWCELTRDAPPFLRAEFVSLQRPLLGAGEPVVAAAYRGDRLAGVLPLIRRGRHLDALRSEHGPRFDYVGDPAGLEAIWMALAAERDWDTLVLGPVRASSPLAIRLPELTLHHGALTLARPAVRSPYMLLPGFETRLPSKQLANIRRCARKLPALELERCTRFSRPSFEAALAVEALAWKGAAGTSMSSHAELRHFYAAVARLASRRGELSLYLLRAGDAVIASLLAIEHAGRLYALKVGYDPAFAALSPGHLLFAEVAREAERRGVLELEFLGHDDEWKRRWTALTHDHVTLVTYRPTARGVATLVARELVKPRLSPRTVETLGALRNTLSNRRVDCPRAALVGVHTPLERAVGRAQQGFGIRSTVRRLRAPLAPARPAVGAPSRFAPGDWVRVVDADRVRRTLDARDRQRGLAFVPAQWETCGKVYQVQGSVRRLVDDGGRPRPVSGTVLLAGVTCDVGGDTRGCGRHCPLMYRDEWLEPAERPAESVQPPVATWARIRSAREIEATLDPDGCRDGVPFTGDMRRLAGARMPVVRRLGQVFELDRWVPTRGPVYLLEGAHCTGVPAGAHGPCDRACALLWHADWLRFEAESGA